MVLSCCLGLNTKIKSVDYLGSLHLSIKTSTAFFFVFPGKKNSFFFSQEKIIIFNCLLVIFCVPSIKSLEIAVCQSL